MISKAKGTKEDAYSCCLGKARVDFVTCEALNTISTLNDLLLRFFKEFLSFYSLLLWPTYILLRTWFS